MLRSLLLILIPRNEQTKKEIFVCGDCIVDDSIGGFWYFDEWIYEGGQCEGNGKRGLGEGETLGDVREVAEVGEGGRGRETEMERSVGMEKGE